MSSLVLYKMDAIIKMFLFYFRHNWLIIMGLWHFTRLAPKLLCTVTNSSHHVRTVIIVKGSKKFNITPGQVPYSTSTENFKTLVSTNELKESLNSNSNVSLVECGPNMNIKELYDEAHIPGSVFFNVAECSDISGKLPLKYMLPEPAAFERYAQLLGISNDSHIIVCERHDIGFFYAPRVWWMFRVFGHDCVSILNGGLVKWVAAGWCYLLLLQVNLNKSDQSGPENVIRSTEIQLIRCELHNRKLIGKLT